MSRAGADEQLSEEVADILEAAGYEVIVQQRDFQQRHFIERMNDALTRGGRVVALLSEDYLASDYCNAEWMNAIAKDPLNKNRRLVALRISPCDPDGLLAGIAYTDLVPVRADRTRFAELVLRSVDERPPREKAPARPAQVGLILDPEMIAAATTFTGRDDEIAEVESALWSGDGTAVVYGLGGMGKSTLAREYAWRNRERYAAIAWLAAETEPGIVEGLLRMGTRLAPELDRVSDRHAAAQAVVTMDLARGGKPVLVVFDNLSDPQPLSVWRPHGGAHVIVTTRHAAWPRTIRTTALSPWPVDDGVRYLQDESGRTDLTDADARRITEALGNLPLALASAAAYLRETRTVTVRSYLARIEYHLRNAPHGMQYPRAVFATFQTAIEKCEEEAPGAASVLCLAAFFAPDAIPEELFKQSIDEVETLRPNLPSATTAIDLRAVLGDAVKTEEVLGALDRRSLIAFAVGTRSFSMHRLVQAAARDLVGNESLAWARAAVEAADHAFPAMIGYPEWPTCERLLPHARAALAALPENEMLVWAAHLANKCGTYLRKRADLTAAEALERRALAISEAVYGSNHRLVATNLNNLALTLSNNNRLEEAEPLLRRAIEIYERADESENQSDVAVALTNLGNILYDKDDYAGAEAAYHRAITLEESRVGPDHINVARILNSLAIVFSHTKRTDQAEALLRRAISIYEATYISGEPNVSAPLINLGQLLQVTNRSPDAEPLIQRALAIDEAAYGPDHPEVATDLKHLAEVLRTTGRAGEAEVLLWRALDIELAHYTRDHPAVVWTVKNLAALLTNSGRKAEAEELRRLMDPNT